MKNPENICMKFNCDACCNPVKMKEGFDKNTKENLEKLPFLKRKGMFIPESDMEIRLESYDCKFLDKKNAKCGDYENRPDLCKKSFCKAFETDDAIRQKKIIEEIKREKIICQKK